MSLILLSRRLRVPFLFWHSIGLMDRARLRLRSVLVLLIHISVIPMLSADDITEPEAMRECGQ